MSVLRKAVPLSGVEALVHTPATRSGRRPWGVPEAARGRFTTLFKGGWLPGDERGWTVHQVAKLESDRGPLAIAVLSDGNPSHEYGIETVRGVAKRLLG